MMDETTFEVQLAGFLKAAQTKVNEQYGDIAPSLVASGWRRVIEIDRGPKYIRVLKADYNDPKSPNNCTGRSAYCFIDRTNGNVLKAAGWKAPTLKNPRSNIFSVDFGASGVTGYGAVYVPLGKKKK